MARPIEEVVKGLTVAGRYACDPAALGELAAQWGTDPFLTSLFCWASYLVGMEVPGERALFSRVTLELGGKRRTYSAIDYRAEVSKLDLRFNKAQIRVRVSDGESALASGQCWSFLRASVESGDDTGRPVAEARRDALAGRSAVMIGASRGLGAALEAALSARGAAVVSLSRSGRDGEREVAGDAGDADAIERVRERVRATSGRLDFLVCNAFPPILNLRLEPNAAGRVADYIAGAVAMALQPMCGLLDLLEGSGGCLVLISSTVVEEPVQEWPHYAAAKAAVEMLARTAPLQYPRIRCVIVRPSKLLTGYTNTPVQRLGAVHPAEFAERLAARLETADRAGDAARKEANG